MASCVMPVTSNLLANRVSLHAYLVFRLKTYALFVILSRTTNAFLLCSRYSCIFPEFWIYYQFLDFWDLQSFYAAGSLTRFGLERHQLKLQSQKICRKFILANDLFTYFCPNRSSNGSVPVLPELVYGSASVNDSESPAQQRYLDAWLKNVIHES